MEKETSIYRVALVDDTPAIHEMLKEVLIDEWQLSSFYSCRDFLNYKDKLAFDIVLLDVQFPGESGFDLLTELKGDTKLKQIPVIILTELGDLDHEKEGFLLGANDFIAKPFKLGELLIRMKASIQRTQELLLVALIDSLTELYNLRAFEKMAVKEIDQAHQHGYPLVFTLIDLNHFKKVNDEKGHQAGNSYLKSFADLLRFNFTKNSVVFRYGGDEFIILTPYENSVSVEEKILSLDKTCKSDPNLVKLSWHGFCCGLAEYPKDGDSLDQLIEKADQQMYGKKNQDVHS